MILSFRIIKQSYVAIKYIICKDIPHESIRYSEYWKYAIVEDKEKRDFESLNSQDLDQIVDGYNKIKEFESIKGRTLHAINFLFLAYTSYYWMETFILFMTSIETLVSPSDERQITTRIIKRVRGLISDSNICSRKKIERLYKLRSNILHGRILENINFSEHKNELQYLQIIVLNAFQKILSEDFQSIYKNEESKEKFYSQYEKMAKSISRTISEIVFTIKTFIGKFL